MLNATLHCNLAQKESPTSQNMLNNLYVDNIVTGCSSEAEAVNYYNGARTIMKSAHFNLRRCASNNSLLMDRANRDKVVDTNNPVNILELQRNTQDDILSRSHPSEVSKLWSPRENCWRNHPRYLTPWDCCLQWLSKQRYSCNPYGNAT